MCVKWARDFGCTVFNVNYRLAPEHKCPTGIMDYVAVIKYVLANTAEYNVDPNRIVLAGISGGGMSAAAAAYHLALNNESDKIKACFLWCP